MPTDTAQAPPATPITTANIPLDLIDRSRNHRVARPGDEARIASLMETIGKDGQLQPVRVYAVAEPKDGGPSYILGFGWRRCAALEGLGRKTVRAEVFPPTADHDIEAARAVENLHRQDITPIEQAQAVADIIAAYQKDRPTEPRQAAIEHAASGTGRSIKWVRDRDYFTRLSAPVRAFANQVPLPAGHLREIAKVGDEQLQLAIALDAAHAPAWALKPGTITPDTSKHDKEVWADYLAGVDSGAVRIVRLSEVQARVAAAQRQLGRVPWSLTLPVLVSGRTALPACDTCESNTANDTTLFGMDPNDPTAPEVGTCMSPACFDAKAKESHRQREKLVVALLRPKNAPTPAKITAKVEAAPGWLDGKRLKGFLQRECKKAGDPTTARGHAHTAKGGASGSPNKKSTDPLHDALDRFDEAVDRWRDEAIKAIIAQSLLDAPRRAGLLLLMFTWAVEDIYRNGQLKVPSHWQRREGTTKVTPARKLDADTHAMLDMIETGRPEEIVQIAAAKPCEWEPVDVQFLPRHPELLTRLMQALKVPAKDNAPAPAWEDFKPKQTPKKKATKKKPVAKRTKKAGAK